MADDTTILYRLEQAEEHIEKLEKKFEAREVERNKQEKKNLIWGITVLGGAASGLLSIVWAYRGVIFK